jgi:hypothetical protein
MNTDRGELAHSVFMDPDFRQDDGMWVAVLRVMPDLIRHP